MTADCAVRTIRRFRISAARRVFHPAWTVAENESVFGRRTSDLGSGGNFTVFVGVESRVDPATGMIVDTDEIRNAVDPVLAAFDHRHLTIETRHFDRLPATSEVIASVLFDLVRPRLPPRVALANVTLWESATRWADCTPEGIRSGTLRDVHWLREADTPSFPALHSVLAVVRSGDALGIEECVMDDACASFAWHSAERGAGEDGIDCAERALSSFRQKLECTCNERRLESRIETVTLSDPLLGDISMDGAGVLRVARKYEFEATHRMYNERLSESENLSLFGKGTNPYGHGHSFVIRVSVKVPGRRGGPSRSPANSMDDAARAVIGTLEGKRLELEVPFFRQNVSTTENLTLLLWSDLGERLGLALDAITVWGTENNVYEIRSNDAGPAILSHRDLHASTGHRPWTWR